MTWEELVAMARVFPEVTEGVAYGEPALRVRKALLTRLREADGSVVVMDIPPEEAEMLIAAEPAVFFSEPHYAGYDIVLARLDRLPPELAQRFLERRWRGRATKAAVARFDRERLGGV